MDGDGGENRVRFRSLRPGEGHVLTEAIRAAYGETYDLRWVYDEDLAVASDHGRELLSYVLADLPTTAEAP